VRIRAQGAPGRRVRCVAPAIALLSLAPTLTLAAPALVAGGAQAPLESATTTSEGSWVVLPMGRLSDEPNTFWQLLHASANSSQWSVATPPGVADNGGLVVGPSGGSALVGFLPNGKLRFSPLSQSASGGGPWNPVLLPAGLGALPDALAYGNPPRERALALVGTTEVLGATGGLSGWTPVVSSARLRSVSAHCRVNAIDAVAVRSSGAALVATGCVGGGGIGLFTQTGASWHDVGPVLPEASPATSTSVLRLETDGTTTALIGTGRSRRRALIALWQTGGDWSLSRALALPATGSVRATSVGPDGTVSVLVGAGGRIDVERVAPGEPWTRLPAPPPGTLAIAPLATPTTLDAPGLDAFTVHGSALTVFALTPSGTSWVKTQSLDVPLAYGSSG
jgi:hypothetical protein